MFMLGYSNMESLKQSIKSGNVFLYSRSRGELWEKGKTSNNILRLQKIICDCDYDALLFKVDNSEFKCHLGPSSCFSNPIKIFTKSELLNEDDEFISKLYNIIKRKKDKKEWSNISYTEFLLCNTKSLNKKIIEEATEVILAVKNNNSEELKQELGDLFYHLLVLMVSNEISLSDIEKILQQRNRGENID